MVKNEAHSAPDHLIIPAAGLGTRMRTVSAVIPKELLPLGDKKIIDYAMEEGLSAGMKHFIIIINTQKEMIRDHIIQNYRGMTSITLHFIYQKQLLGECDAIHHAKDIVGKEPFAVFYPDNIYLPAPGALNTIIPVFKTYDKDVIALTEVDATMAHTISNAGRVDLKNINQNIYQVDAFIPKSHGHFTLRHEGELRACGIYISSSHFFDYIEKIRQTITHGELTDDPVQSAILRDKGYMGCRLPGTVFDAGNPEGYKLCLKSIRKHDQSVHG